MLPPAPTVMRVVPRCSTSCFRMLAVRRVHTWRSQFGPARRSYSNGALIAKAAAVLVVAAEIRRAQSSCRVGRTTLCAVDASQSEEAASAWQQLASEVKLSFSDGAAEWVSEAHAQRMLRATGGDSSLAVKKLKEAVAWRRDTLQGWLAAEAKNLATAETRVIGVGHDSRPLVYSGCVNQRPGEVAGIILACVWDQALQEAGPLAQIDYVLDAHGYQPLLNLNIMPYLRLARSLDSYFAERFHRVVILDMPRGLVWVIKAILAVVPPKTRQKICFAKRGVDDKVLLDLCVTEEMQEMFQQLLKKNGEATTTSGREATRELTDAFLKSQRVRSSQMT